VDAVFTVEVGGYHGTVKSGKAELIEKVKLDGCEVAVAEEWLGILADELKIKTGEKVVGAVAAADGDDERGVGVGEGFVEVSEPMASNSSEEEWPAFKRVGSEARLEAKLAEAFKPFFDAFLIGIGGGREHRDSGSGGG
jgi:uncharacterized hydantoinase/oxoprolinase family protein